MVDQIKEETTIVEDGGQSTWNNYTSKGPFYYPRGALGKFFARFFASPAQQAVTLAANDIEIDDKVLGDTKVQHSDTGGVVAGGGGAFTMNRTTPVYSPIEVTRRARYKEYERMDEYPEVGAAFDIYADDCTQQDTQKRRWIVESGNPEVVKEVNRLFKNIKLDRVYYDICRNVVKFGDCFMELIADVNNINAGIQKIKVLNPNYVIRVENEYGYLKTFLQQIPDKGTFDTDLGSQDQYATIGTRDTKYVELDKNQIVHFRTFNSDPKFYPYGKSIAAYSVQTFRSLRLMEDAMLIYRLARAPERRIFYIDVGNLPSSKAEMFVERVKEKFKKEKYFNKGGVDARYKPLAADEDYFVPIKGNQGTKIETLPGASNLGEVTDVSYFRDKLLASLKVPKDFIVEKDKSPERKANLSELDVKFARAVSRIQHEIEVGLEVIAKRHLALKNFPNSLISELRILLPDPSDRFTKRKLEIDQARLQIIQTVAQTQLFPKDYIYKEYYDMSEGEIQIMKQKLKEEAQDAAFQQQELNQVAPGAGDLAPGNTPGGQEAVPTQGQREEDDFSNILKLKTKSLVGGGYSLREAKIWDRIKTKITNF